MEKWHDEIVAEVRKTRDEYAKKFDYDVKAICRDLRERQGSTGHRVVRHDAVKS